jgi:hypothetical protein
MSNSISSSARAGAEAIDPCDDDGPGARPSRDSAGDRDEDGRDGASADDVVFAAGATEATGAKNCCVVGVVDAGCAGAKLVGAGKLLTALGGDVDTARVCTGDDGDDSDDGDDGDDDAKDVGGGGNEDSGSDGTLAPVSMKRSKPGTSGRRKRISRRLGCVATER